MQTLDVGHPLYDAFISYARADGVDEATWLEDELHTRGLRTWRDTRGIDPSHDFTAEIERAIEESRNVVACITPDVRRADSFVRREIGYALALGKPVLVARFKEVPPPISVINHTQLDFFTARDYQLGQLENLLRQKARIYSPPTSTVVDPFRAYLERLYQQIVRELKLTILSDAVIPLRAHETLDAGQVTLPAILTTAIFGDDDTPNGQLRDFDSFAEAFETFNNRLLLLGEPGAGKTTTLLAFAREVVAARLADSSQVLPILTRISSWDIKKQPELADWIMMQNLLLDRAAFDREITQGNVLFLLDALDELGAARPDESGLLGEDPRHAFIDMLAGSEIAARLVITCRVKEYREIGRKVSVDGAVMLQPLDDERLKQYLSPVPDLWTILQGDRDLKEAARTPLLIALFRFAFARLPDEARGLRDLDLGDVRDKIFELYVDRRYAFEASKRAMPYALIELRTALGELAFWNALDFNSTAGVVSESTIATSLPLGDAGSYTDLACSLQFMTPIGDGKYRFLHLLLRDHFAFRSAQDRLSSANSNTRRSAVYALGRLGDTRALKYLMDAIHDGDGEVRRAAALALASTDLPVVDSLIDALQTSDLEVRNSLIFTLTLIGADAVKPLADLLHSSPSGLGWLAATALGKINDERALSPLIQALAHPLTEVRFCAATALGELGDPRAVQPLVQALSISEDDVATGILAALRKLGTPEALDAVHRWYSSRH
ncbi:MAG: HEAT repeat domain-containing protein [Anaerolineae bacterium]|nr:HEAT repeat domain-containing protein [Anaerolineae bacterium]